MQTASNIHTSQATQLFALQIASPQLQRIVANQSMTLMIQQAEHTQHNPQESLRHLLQQQESINQRVQVMQRLAQQQEERSLQQEENLRRMETRLQQTAVPTSNEQDNSTAALRYPSPPLDDDANKTKQQQQRKRPAEDEVPAHTRASDSEGNCPLCQELVETRGGRMVINPGCGHSMHEDCFRSYATRFRVCSICRRPLPEMSSTQGPPPPSLHAFRIIPRVIQDINGLSVQFPALLFPAAAAAAIAAPNIIIPRANTPTTAQHCGGDAVQTVPRIQPHNPHDDDVIVFPPATQRSGATANHPPLDLSLASEQSVVSARSSTTLNCVLSVRAPQQQQRSFNIDIVLVVDVTMSGEQMLQLKRITRLILSKLNQADRLAVVAFGEKGAERRAPLLFVNDANNLKWQAVVDNLAERSAVSAGGTGASTCAGFTLGLDIITKRQTKNELATIILLTHTRDARPYRADTLCRKARATGCPVHTISLSPETSASTLSSIAQRTGGTFTHLSPVTNIDNNNHAPQHYDLQPTVHALLAGLLSSVAQRLELTLTVPDSASNVVFAGIVSKYGALMSSSRRRCRVYIHDLWSGERRDLVFKLKIEGGDRIHTGSSNELVHADVRYHDLRTGRHVASLGSPVNLTIRYGDETPVTNMFVRENERREMVATSITAGLRDPHGAEGVLSSAATTLSLDGLEGLKAEVDEVKGWLSKGREGAARAFSRALVVGLQRGLFGRWATECVRKVNVVVID